MHSGNFTAVDDPGSRPGQSFQELLLRLSAAAAQGHDTKSLLRFFCETTREFFQASGSYFWQVVSPDELVGIEADGLMADEFRGTRLSLKTGPSAVALESIRSRKTVYLNNVDAERYSMEREYRARSIMAAPLIVSGEVIGATVFLHDSDPEFFSEDLAAKATILAGQAAVALEMKRNLHLSEQHRRRSEALMSLALESSSLLRLPEFARRFVSRVAGMLDAHAAALALHQDSKLETVVLQGTGSNDLALVRRLNVALSGLLLEHRHPIFSAPANELLGPLASSLGWNDLTVARLRGTDGELVGLLCLANLGHATNHDDEQLLQAIIGQASVALENARLFTRMDQANRHWSEIFDALSDFIVVHDEHHRVLRVNRSLAEFVGVPPPELIGISMSALMSVAPDIAPRCCPFCRSDVEGPDDFVQPVLECTYLVSTSRVHASESESLQTIHVLKDITDRREAERRYRELFDNIQEGLFFTSPEGRFIEVNEALVRMLGYQSREELLQAEVPAQIRRRQPARPGANAGTPPRANPVDGTARRSTELSRDSASQRRLPYPRVDECFRGSRRPGPIDAMPRPHARHHRPQELPSRTAARARFLRQDPQQHPEPDSGGRHRRSDQLRQPALVRGRRLSTAAVAGPPADGTDCPRPPLCHARCALRHPLRPAGGQP